ncbi:tetratricopeptide repeat protein [Aquibacillus kalidii]|uniref:tetratricopeptide repeat protein n=1 Tax=Aquibacillus kalidii TaxID=2762597 RepID=UPI001F26481A|nr:tetratricopeptide repeat protein [Aquibacillus kalidii]
MNIVWKTYFYKKEAAEKGHADALNNYADMYLRGEYVEKNEERALELFKKAADKGVPESMYTLGYMYENGVGTEVDMVESKVYRVRPSYPDLGDMVILKEDKLDRLPQLLTINKRKVNGGV